MLSLSESYVVYIKRDVEKKQASLRHKGTRGHTTGSR